LQIWLISVPWENVPRINVTALAREVTKGFAKYTPVRKNVPGLELITV